MRWAWLGLWLWSATAWADESPAPVVRVELASGGPAIEGRWAIGTLRMVTENGIQELYGHRIEHLIFGHAARGEPTKDVVELADHTRLRGEVDLKTVVLLTATGERTFTRAEVHEIRAVHGRNSGMLAILIGLLTLAAMEIVLGIDNVIFLTIVAGKLPPEQQPRARQFGLAAALGTRLLLLASLSFIMGLTKPLFTLPDLPFFHEMEAREVSWRDLILLAGGLFLIGKSTYEMHEKLEHAAAVASGQPTTGPVPSFASVLIQIAILDIIFSLDSVITAVGMVEQLWVMVTAMVIAMLVMLVFAGPIGDFVTKHPTLKMLALAFLILIGVLLVAEGLGQHLDKGYIYSAMAFALLVEMINLRLRKG